MLYPLVLTIHSWLRWLVVGLAVLVTLHAVRARSKGQTYGPVDNLLSVSFVALLDTQVLLGLVLYVFLSPMTSAAFQNMGAAMRSSPLRFFVIEHAFSMLLALGFAHAARIRVRRRAESRDKHHQTSIFVGLSLVCVLVGIPWPFLPYARPLARLDTPGEAPAQASALPAELESSRALFQSRCSPCHGPEGRGDGPTAKSLVPRPRDFHDPLWQKNTTDESIERIIREGGLALGKSPLMPPNPDLDAAAVRKMRDYLRTLGR